MERGKRGLQKWIGKIVETRFEQQKVKPNESSLRSVSNFEEVLSDLAQRCGLPKPSI
jgi:hypothetical protein